MSLHTPPSAPPPPARTNGDAGYSSNGPFLSFSASPPPALHPRMYFEPETEAGPSRLPPPQNIAPPPPPQAQEITEVPRGGAPPASRPPFQPWVNAETTSLHQAVLAGDLQLVEQNLDGGASINLTDQNNMSSLHIACSQSEPPNPRLLELLLRRGAHVNAVDRNNWNALLYATFHGFDQAVLILLEHGANMSYVTNIGWTALHMTDKVEIAQYLLNFGANPNCLDTHARSPLFLAARRGNLPLARLLIQREARADIKDNYLASALTHCIMGGDHPDIARLLLLNGVKSTDVDIYGYTLLHHAAAYDRRDTAVLLLESGANVHAAANWLGWPNQMMLNRPPMGELLDRQGGASNHGGGMTPAHVAAHAGAAATLRVLLEQGQARVDQSSRENMTALHYCSRGGDHVDAAQVLIEHGADPNVKGNERMTPLHFAAAAGRRTLAEYLVNNGGDATALTKKGMTPAQLAMTGGYKELHALLSARDKRGAITKMKDALRN